MSDNRSTNLGDDYFVRSVIHRHVGKLIAQSDFTQQDRNDLVQEVYVRATKSLRLFDPSVGHLYPYVCTVVQRHLANVVRDRSVVKRTTAGRVSLSKTVRGDDGGQVEMSQTLHDRDQDRRLGRARRLDEEQLNDLRMDRHPFGSQGTWYPWWYGPIGVVSLFGSVVSNSRPKKISFAFMVMFLLGARCGVRRVSCFATTHMKPCGGGIIQRIASCFPSNFACFRGCKRCPNITPPLRPNMLRITRRTCDQNATVRKRCPHVLRCKVTEE